MHLVDFHCHLDLYPDPAAAIAQTAAGGIYTLTVTTTPRAWPQNLKLIRDAPRIRAALGLHPQLVSGQAHEMDIWEKYLPEARYVGEVGLDAGPRFYDSLDLQKRIFERILKQCANVGDKILTVHSVRTAKTVLEMIEAHLPASRGTVVLHWFTGSRSELRQAVDMGCYFSVNSAMLGNDRGKALVREIPENRLLTETDGPFTSINGHPSSPRDIPVIINQLAELRTKSAATISELVFSNMRNLCAD